MTATLMDESRCVRPAPRPPADVSGETGLISLSCLPKKLQMRYATQETSQDKAASERQATHVIRAALQSLLMLIKKQQSPNKKNNIAQTQAQKRWLDATERSKQWVKVA